MRPMTPEQRAEVSLHLPYGHRVATPALVAIVAKGTSDVPDAPSLDAHPGDVRAVLRRLLNTEQQLATCRRLLATAVVTADHLPDDGLTAGDILHLLTGSGLDLRAEIEHAEALREAEALAGVG